MKATELRLGNITDKGVVTGLPMGCTHSEWNISCEYHDQFNFDDVNPIPLTEEWLLRLGIENTSHWGFIMYGIGDFELGEDKGEWFWVDCKRQLSLKVKYVHQLQNLYFALTDEELVIKKADHENKTNIS